MQIECLPSVPKPRKQRKTEEGDFAGSHGPSFPNEVAAGSSAAPIQAPRTLQAPVSRPAPASIQDRIPTDSLLTRNDLHHSGSKSFLSLLAQSSGLDALATSPLELLSGIDATALVTACTIFRQYSAHFPFVNVPMRVESVSMALHRPMTALAVCTVTASADSQRQERLSRAFRLALSTKAIVNGERNVDLMVGLLIHLAWQHHYMTKARLYQDLSLLCGMAVDLGLYTQPPRKDIKDPVTAAELDRAFVGTYYLCSLVSYFAFDKHAPMRWTDNLRLCADNLAQVGELQSDRSLPALVELAAAMDDLQSALQLDRRPDTQSSAFVVAQAKATFHRLRVLRRDHTALTSNAVLAACLIDTQHRQLDYSESSSDPSFVVQCACAIKEYFDDMLSKAPHVLHQVPVVDWSCLLHNMVLMARLSKKAATASCWEQGAIAPMLLPEQTMEKLVGYMASTPAGDPLAPRHEGLLQWLHQFVQNTQDLFLKSESGAMAKQAEGSDARFRPMNNDSSSLADRALPYQRQEVPSRAHAHGVLDSDFWGHIANS